MKKNILSFLFLALLGISAQAQSSSICNGDSAKITLTNYISGSIIQWQSSANATTWNNIPGATSASVSLKPNANTYFRATVNQGVGCPVYYSDTTYITVHNWTAAVTVANINTQTVGTSTFTASSKLKVTWNPPAGYTVDHYVVTAAEGIKSTKVTMTVPPTQATDTLTELKSGTTYSVTVKACQNAACTNYLDCSGTSTGTTSEEYWQLQGTGDTTTTLTKIVADGNVLNYAFVYGSWAPTPALDGYIRYYYTPANTTQKGTKPAISDYLPVTNTNSTVTSFTGFAGTGLTYDGYVSGNGSPKTIGQAQAIPYNGTINMFFEANMDDQFARIFRINSKDGYTGLDFNSGASTICTNPTDFTTSGGCPLTQILGVESDPVPFYNPSITDIRQFKIGYRTMDSWLWTGADSTYMTPTFDFNTTVVCGETYKFTTGFVLYDSINDKWNLQYSSALCPYYFDGMQAPSSVHRGGNKYKLYYNQNATLKGVPHNPQTDTKPMKVIYAERDNGQIKFEDWESVSNSRNLNYLWPNGDLLTVAQESKLDDYHFFAPTNDMEFQVQYTNISNGVTQPFVTAAVLLNP